MRILSFVLALALLAPAQQRVTFQVSSKLVIVNVGVRNRAGKIIDNLKLEDFTVLEDGKPQIISVFDFQRIAGDAEAATSARPPAAETGKPAITPSKEGRVRYKDKRLIVLFFDLSSMPPSDQIRAQKAGIDFLDHKLTASDMVSIMIFSTRLRVLQDFTNDRETLRSIIEGFRIGETSDLAEQTATSTDEATDDPSFVPDDTEFTIFNTDRKLSALESAAQMMASLPEKKAIVYFSSGVGKTGVENQSQLSATVNAAIRANVAFYPVDARGLLAVAPAGDASQGARSGSGVFSGRTQRQERDTFQDQQETLYTLAADTGGKALLDSNDLSLGITEAQAGIGSYYILGYYTSNPAEDGRYRRVQVMLKPRLQAKVDYRTGYFAPKQFKDFDASDKERQLEDALLLGDPITELPLAVEVDYFRLSRNSYFIPVAVKIPGTEIELVRRRGADTARLEFIGQIRDSKGKIAGAVRDNIRLKLTGENAAQLGKRAVQYDTGFTLPPGDYRLKFLARENTSGKMGTFEAQFHVPDLDSQDKTLRLSSVVWSNQREPLSAAVGAAERNRIALATHPLVRDGQKLLPSITRAFRRDQTLYVYFEVYEPGTDPVRKVPSIHASLSWFRGKSKAFESEAVQASQSQRSRRRTIPVEFQVPLAKLRPGTYICQVNIIDEYGRKFAFPRARLALLP